MPPPISYTPLIVLVAIVVVAASAGGAFLYYHNRPSSPAQPRTVTLEDNVTVNYIGIFGSGPEQGKVFDTSLYSVAVNNIAYPKSIGYHERGPLPSNYSTLDVHVGGNTPSAGYTLGGLTFIQVVTGFWEGLVGATPNVTKTIVVPPAEGYGPVNAACVATKSLSFTLPVVQTMAGTAFQKLYPGQLSTTGAEFPDPHYGWPVLILAANASFVTIENLPSVGYTASPGGWPIVVENVSSTANGTGQITLVNELYPSQAGLFQGKDYLGTGPCSSQASGKFILTAVNLANGTFTENFNQEVQGQTLIFIVTVVDVFPPATSPVA
jgi:FKBP-type peptidyl-prolyl cis-trans isomerase 2